MVRFMLDFEKPVIELEEKLDDLKRLARNKQETYSVEIKELKEKIDEVKEQAFKDLSAWQKVQIARHQERPLAYDYCEMIFNDFVEMHGDRLFRDDKAIIGGPAFLEAHAVMIIGEQKGRGTGDKIACNFGMPHPEGYRKALRLMKMAEKFQLPVISFIDTQGAYPGVEAEERGQAWAIAENLKEMSSLKTPIIAINIGEGGSGGALAMGVADRVLMLENAYYSVITPEGCASILYKDVSRAEEAAESLKLTAGELKEYGIIDDVVREPIGGAHRGAEETAENLKTMLIKSLDTIKAIPITELLDQRYERLRNVGHYEEEQEPITP